jgi:hypothetical protein
MRAIERLGHRCCTLCVVRTYGNASTLVCSTEVYQVGSITDLTQPLGEHASIASILSIWANDN